jgi:hypothetical protein
MPPTTDTDLDPVATRTMPITATSMVGISAVSVKTRRARFRNTVVGERSFTPSIVSDLGRLCCAGRQFLGFARHLGRARRLEDVLRGSSKIPD